MTQAQQDRVRGENLFGWTALDATPVGTDLKLTLRCWSGELRTLWIDSRGLAIAVEA